MSEQPGCPLSGAWQSNLPPDLVAVSQSEGHRSPVLQQDRADSCLERAGILRGRPVARQSEAREAGGGWRSLEIRHTGERGASLDDGRAARGAGKL